MCACQSSLGLNIKAGLQKKPLNDDTVYMHLQNKQLNKRFSCPRTQQTHWCWVWIMLFEMGKTICSMVGTYCFDWIAAGNHSGRPEEQVWFPVLCFHSKSSTYASMYSQQMKMQITTLSEQRRKRSSCSLVASTPKIYLFNSYLKWRIWIALTPTGLTNNQSQGVYTVKSAH